eukprot:Gb_38518 [translate_table: standard]
MALLLVQDLRDLIIRLTMYSSIIVDRTSRQRSSLSSTDISVSSMCASFSIRRNYERSPWCLAELSFMRKTGSKIIPVYYDVQPSDATLLKRIVESLVQEVKGEVLDVAKHPVGLDEAVDQLEKAMMEAGQQSAGNRKLLQKLVHYDWEFNSTSEGKEILRNQLLGSKVLIVLDDINHVDQIEALLVSDVLGSDSLIIITSRDKGVLTNSGISAIYELKGLQQKHAQELFCWYNAFLLPCPMKGFEDLVEKFLNKCSGLPLSLKVIGSLLYGHRDLIFYLLSAEGDSILTKFSSLSKDLLWLRWCDCPYNSIPPHISMKNLRVLELSGKFDFQTLWHSYGSYTVAKTPFLGELPQELGELSNLRDLRVGSRLLRALPLSLGNLNCLKSLVLLNCSMLNSLPDSIGQLKSLEELNIYDSGVENLPEGVAYLNNLRYLTVRRCPLGDVTFESVGVEGEISDCRNPLMSKRMFGLKSITLESTKTSKICISKDACPNLEALEATYCQSLNHVEGLPITLVNLNLSGCDGLKKISGLSNLAKLRYLNISGCLELEELEDLVQLTLLKYFIADGCSMLKKVGSLQQLKQLKEMQITAEQNAIWKDIQFLKDLPSTVSSITMNARTIGGDEREVYSILTSFSFSLTVLDFSPNGLCKVEIAEAKSCSAIIVVFICRSSTERHDPIKDLLKLGSNYCMQEYFVNVNIECECEWIIMSLFTKDTMFLQESKRVKIEDNVGVYANLPNNFESNKGWMVVVGDGEEWKIPKAWGKLFTYIQSKQLGDHLQS